jgi:hypothetical protein
MTWEADVTVAVRVSVKVTGHRRLGGPEDSLSLGLPPGPVTAWQIIEAAVVAEAAAYEARAGEASLVRVLTDRALRDDLDRGTVRTGGVEPAGPVDLAAAVETAWQAFDDGMFKVFVDDQEVADDVLIDLTDEAALLFLRLVPLAGG